MDVQPFRFLVEPIQALFDRPPVLKKRPGCPDGFIWREREYRVIEKLGEWQDYQRRGRMARNMAPRHAATAARRGSWGVGKFYFRVRTDTGQIFDIYYDRAPAGAGDREGSWFVFRELRAGDAGHSESQEQRANG